MVTCSFAINFSWPDKCIASGKYSFITSRHKYEWCCFIMDLFSEAYCTFQFRVCTFFEVDYINEPKAYWKKLSKFTAFVSRRKCSPVFSAKCAVQYSKRDWRLRRFQCRLIRDTVLSQCPIIPSGASIQFFFQNGRSHCPLPNCKWLVMLCWAQTLALFRLTCQVGLVVEF